MLQAGMTKIRSEILCAIDRPEVAALARAKGCTRAAAAMELLAPQLDGAIVAIGNAPTALWKVMELARSGGPRPALVVGLPVGFVGARESKLALLESDLCYITNTSPRGGSPVAAAAVNALATLEQEELWKSSGKSWWRSWPSAVFLWPTPAHAMHLSEGILPFDWAGLWFLAAAPFVFWGLWTIKRRRGGRSRGDDPGGDGGSGDLRHLVHARAHSLDRHLLASLRHGPGALADRPRADGRRGQHRPAVSSPVPGPRRIDDPGGQHRFDGRGRGLQGVWRVLRSCGGSACRCSPRRWRPA